MIRSKAILKKCLECSGDTSKEVTLCHIFDCPLWQFRFGNSLFVNKGGKISVNKVFDARMESIKERWPEEFELIKKVAPEYLQNIREKKFKAYLATFLQKKSPRPIPLHSPNPDPF